MDRKKFIISSSFFLLGVNFLRASSLIPSDYFQSKNTDTTNISLLLKEAAELRKQSFVKKQNPIAMSRRAFFSSPMATNSSTSTADTVYAIYDKVLAKNPSEIRAYNGKRKFMLQQSEQLLDVVNMYVDGVQSNPEQALFKERTAKEYLRVLSGSAKQIKNLPYPLNDRTKLLKTIESYYEQAIRQDNTNVQFIIQLEKLRELKAIGFFEMDSRKNRQLKARKKQNKEVARRDRETLTSTDYALKIKRLKARAGDNYRLADLLISEKRYIKNLQKEKQYSKAVEEAVKYYKRNSEDVDGLKLVRLTLKKNKRYDLLESIERDNNKRQNTLWSNLALFNVLMKRVELSGSKNYTELSSLLKKSTALAEFNNEKFELKCKEFSLAIYMKSSTLPQQLVEYGWELIGLRVPYRIDRYTRLCVDYYLSIGQTDKALTAIDIMMSLNTDSELEDNILDTLKRIAEFREKAVEGQGEELIFLKQKILNA